MHLFIYLIGFCLSVVVLRAAYGRDSHYAGYEDVQAFAVSLVWPVWIPVFFALYFGKRLGSRK